MSLRSRARSLSAALALLAASSCYIDIDEHGDGPRVTGSGVVVSQRRAPGVFHALDARGAYRLEVRVGPPTEVVVECDDNLLELLETSVRDGVLRVRTHGRVSSSAGITLRIQTPELRALESSGSSELDVDGLAGERFEIDAAGSLVGSARGRVDELRLDASGSIDLDLEGLAVRRAALDVSGSSTLALNVEERLTGDVSGSSSIRYRGEPAIDLDQSGSARLTRIE